LLNQIAAIHGTGVAASTTSYESIATLSGNGSSGTISFTSIPSTYKHLQLRAILRESSGGGSNDTFLGLRFNNDTAANYALHYLIGDGSSASANGVGGWSWGYSAIATQNAAGANICGVMVLDILDYANTNKYKTARSLSGNDRNGAGSVTLISSLWRDTTAINRVDVYSKDGQSLSSLSSIALYGIKG
jgi:hypothetical protein